MKPSAEKASHKRGLLDMLRTLAHKPEALLHARRRKAAMRRLAESDFKSVLFLCHGNICRSPFAAAAFAKELPHSLSTRIRIDSAGFIGPGRSPPAAALVAAKRRGIDMRRHKSKIATAQLLRKADLIVVMAMEQLTGVKARISPSPAHVLVLGDLDPQPIVRRTIIDPWNHDDAVFEASYSRIQRCVEELARTFADAS